MMPEHWKRLWLKNEKQERAMNLEKTRKYKCGLVEYLTRQDKTAKLFVDMGVWTAIRTMSLTYSLLVYKQIFTRILYAEAFNVGQFHRRGDKMSWSYSQLHTVFGSTGARDTGLTRMVEYPGHVPVLSLHVPGIRRWRCGLLIPAGLEDTGFHGSAISSWHQK